MTHHFFELFELLSNFAPFFNATGVVVDLSDNYFQGPAPSNTGTNVVVNGNCLQSLPNQRSLQDCRSFYASRGLIFDSGTKERLCNLTHFDENHGRNFLSCKLLVLTLVVDNIKFGTTGSGDNCTLNLDVDGHLYILNATGNNIHNVTDVEPPTKEAKIYMVRLDVDGIVRAYSHMLDSNGKWSIWWNSTMNKCDPLGQCGFNLFCVLRDTNADCKLVKLNPEKFEFFLG
ncbi:unnamed protein product [Camellia sinensis]